MDDASPKKNMTIALSASNSVRFSLLSAKHAAKNDWRTNLRAAAILDRNSGPPGDCFGCARSCRLPGVQRECPMGGSLVGARLVPGLDAQLVTRICHFTRRGIIHPLCGGHGESDRTERCRVTDPTALWGLDSPNGRARRVAPGTFTRKSSIVRSDGERYAVAFAWKPNLE